MQVAAGRADCCVLDAWLGALSGSGSSSGSKGMSGSPTSSKSASSLSAHVRHSQRALSNSSSLLQFTWTTMDVGTGPYRRARAAGPYFDAASFSQHVTQVPHTCCCLFSPLQLQVCFRLSGGIIPRWSHLILMFCLHCVCCFIMPLALQVNRTDVSIGAPGFDLRALWFSW